MRRRPARGTSIAEVLVAVSILAYCAIPVVTMLTMEHGKAHFNEFRLNARSQARWSSSALETLDFAHLLALAETSVEDAGGIPGLFDPDLKLVPDLAPPLETELAPYIRKEPGSRAFLEHAVGRDRLFTRRCYFKELAPGLGCIVVHLSWKRPGGRTNDVSYYVHRRLVVRPELSLTTNAKIKTS